MFPRGIRRTTPSPETIGRGLKILSMLNLDAPASGAIVTEPGFDSFSGFHRSDPVRSAHSPRNLFRVSDFVLTDGDNRDVLRIEQRSRMPSRFSVLQEADESGTIEMRGLIRTRSLLTLAGGANWMFCMPPFSLDFYGESDGGLHVWAQVGPAKTQWNLLLEPEAHDVRIVAWLAFLHRRWWCYG